MTPTRPRSAEAEAPIPATRIDARGLRCPQPVIRLARAAREHPPGVAILVLADDPAARYDIPAWARLKGHAVSVHDEGEHTAYRLVIGDGSQASKSTGGA